MPLSVATIANAIERVEQDVVDGFNDALTPDGAVAFAVDLEETGLTSDDAVGSSDVVVAIPWVFQCRHTGTFIGVQATFVHLELRGTTIVHVVEPDADTWRYHRYIDYLCRAASDGHLHRCPPGADPRRIPRVEGAHRIALKHACVARRRSSENRASVEQLTARCISSNIPRSRRRRDAPQTPRRHSGARPDAVVP